MLFGPVYRAAQAQASSAAALPRPQPWRKTPLAAVGFGWDPSGCSTAICFAAMPQRYQKRSWQHQRILFVSQEQWKRVRAGTAGKPAQHSTGTFAATCKSAQPGLSSSRGHASCGVPCLSLSQGSNLHRFLMFNLYPQPFQQAMPPKTKRRGLETLLFSQGTGMRFPLCKVPAWAGAEGSKRRAGLRGGRDLKAREIQPSSIACAETPF